MFVVCLLFVFGQLHAQETVRLILRYEPEQSYDIQYYNKTTSTYNFSGNDRFVNSLKSKGLSLPFQNVSERKEHSVIHTQKEKNGKLPFRIDLINNTQTEQTAGQETKQTEEKNIKNYIKGSILEGNKIVLTHFRGLHAKELNEMAIQLTQNQLFGDVFPVDELQLLDEFTTHTQTALNLSEDLSLLMKTDKTYTLTKIEKDDVYLTYTSSSSIDPISDQNVVFTAVGSGTLRYNKTTQLIELKEGINQINIQFEAKEGIITHTENLVVYKEEVQHRN